jgi:oligopeptide/dipeptide ABC transporter ATP-binding protein
MSDTGVVAVSSSVETGSSEPLLEVDDLEVKIRASDRVIHAVNGLSFSIGVGEAVAILGESGCGKSVAVRAIMGTSPTPPVYVTRGAIRFKGRDLLGLEEKQRRQLRGPSIGMVAQDALSALNPVFTVGDQIAEMFRVHAGAGRKEAKKQALELMERVRIPNSEKRLNDYPHQFSGGMRQRVLIAMAIALQPDLLIADEPTTALDVTAQARILDLLVDLRDDFGMALAIVTHDLGVAAEIADRAVVMYAGRAVETGPVQDVYERPGHPYSQGLVASVPSIEHRGELSVTIPGSPPDMSALPSGCSFHPRCRYAEPICTERRPDYVEIGPGRRSACHFPALAEGEA